VSTYRWALVGKVVRAPDVWLVYMGPQPVWLPAASLRGDVGERIVELASSAGARIL
jgi:hypothetical protein